MRNVDNWRASKFELHKGVVRASRNAQNVGIGSRLIVDLIGKIYQDQIPKYCSGKLLDLGCGHVPLYFLYRDLIDESVCVDWAESIHQNEHLDIVHDLTQPLPLNDNQFDTVVCSDVLEHIPTPLTTFAEISRVLKPGGKLLLNVPFMYWVHEQPHDFHRYTEFALRHYCAEAGLNVVDLRSCGGSLDVVSDVMSKTFMQLGKIGLPFALTCHWLACLLRPLIQNSAQFPLFYFLVASKPE